LNLGRDHDGEELIASGDDGKQARPSPSSFFIRYSLFAIRHSLLAIRHSLLAIRHSLRQPSAAIRLQTNGTSQGARV
jgi:hypothetical protein